MNRRVWFEQQIDTHETKLLRYVARFVSPSVAGEIVQEAYFRLWTAGPDQTLGFEAPWLFKVCRNLALNSASHESVVRFAANDPSLLPESEDSAEVLLLRRESESQIAARIKSLPENVQEVLRLKFVEGFSYREISEITGHSVSYVGVLIHEGVTNLRQYIAPEQRRQK